MMTMMVILILKHTARSIWHKKQLLPPESRFQNYRQQPHVIRL